MPGSRFSLRHGNQSLQKRASIFLLNGTGPLSRDLIPGFNPDAVELGVTEETDVNADGHARLEHVVAVRAEERRFRLVQADRVREGTDQILREVMLGEVGTRRSVNLLADLAGQELRLGQPERFLEVPHADLLPFGVAAPDRQGIADHAGISGDLRRDADHGQLAWLAGAWSWRWEPRRWSARRCRRWH